MEINPKLRYRVLSRFSDYKLMHNGLRWIVYDHIKSGGWGNGDTATWIDSYNRISENDAKCLTPISFNEYTKLLYERG